MNAGAYVTGGQLKRLGEYYARAIHDHYGLDFDVLFGPAYKGIPLSVATAMALHELYGAEIRYSAAFPVVEMLHHIRHGNNRIGRNAVQLRNLRKSALLSLSAFHAVQRYNQSLYLNLALRLQNREGLFDGFP